MTAPEPTPTRRLWPSLTVVVILLAGGAAALLLWLRSGEEGPSFRAETQAILEQLSRGEAGEIYDEASPRFQAVVLRTRFFDMVADIQENLGAFRELRATKTSELTRGPKGKAGKVTAQVVFEKASTTAAFSYHLIDGQWRLLGMSVDVPEQLESIVASPEARRARVVAPPEIVKLATSVLKRSNPVDGKLIWAEASPAFRESVPLPVFLELLAKRERVLGEFERIVDVIEARQNPSQSGATLVVVVQYAKMKTTATLSFQQLADTWQLITYKVIIPVPRVPGRPPPSE